MRRSSRDARPPRGLSRGLKAPGILHNRLAHAFFLEEAVNGSSNIAASAPLGARDSPRANGNYGAAAGGHPHGAGKHPRSICGERRPRARCRRANTGVGQVPESRGGSTDCARPQFLLAGAETLVMSLWRGLRSRHPGRSIEPVLQRVEARPGTGDALRQAHARHPARRQPAASSVLLGRVHPSRRHGALLEGPR
jgi:hypothetical protein